MPELRRGSRPGLVQQRDLFMYVQPHAAASACPQLRTALPFAHRHLRHVSHAGATCASGYSKTSTGDCNACTAAGQNPTSCSGFEVNSCRCTGCRAGFGLLTADGSCPTVGWAAWRTSWILRRGSPPCPCPPASAPIYSAPSLAAPATSPLRASAAAKRAQWAIPAMAAAAAPCAPTPRLSALLEALVLPMPPHLARPKGPALAPDASPGLTWRPRPAR